MPASRKRIPLTGIPYYQRLTLLLLILLYSCGRGVLYNDTKRIPDNVWNQYERIRFEVPVPDTVNSYRVLLNIRHTSDYRYSNIYFFIHTRFPDGRTVSDTLGCVLARPDGKWLGKGFTGIKDLEVLLRASLRFPAKGT